VVAFIVYRSKVLFFSISSMNSTSQFGQDTHVLHTIYKSKLTGYFVEIGAYNGIESSNTYILEQLGWNGVCVECNPKFYNELIKNRNSKNFPYAVYTTDGDTMDFYDSGGYAGLVKTNNHAHIINDPIIKVQTKTLPSILKEANAPNFIEYLSLDTEGSEFDILSTHDFETYKFGYICVEHNRVEPNRSNIRRLLESKGYRHYRENGNTQWGVIDDEYILVNIDQYLKN
jgi:FkbM family methyltransferase